MLSRTISLVGALPSSRTARLYLLNWTLLALLGGVIFLLSLRQGLTFEAPRITINVVAALMSLGILFYGIFGAQTRVGPMLFFLGLWLATRPLGFAFTYLFASLNLPLLDSTFDAFDRALGFDWLSWFRFVNAHEGLKFVLAAAYTSMSLQIVFSIIYFSHRGENHKNNELWWLCTVGLVITTIGSGLLPAVCPFGYYGVVEGVRGAHLQDLLGLRDGTKTVFNMDAMVGIIALPSYHTVATILLTYIYRNHRAMLRIVLPLNVVQLIAIPSEGGHYIADMLAGTVVALVAIWIVRGMGLGAPVKGCVTERSGQ